MSRTRKMCQCWKTRSPVETARVHCHHRRKPVHLHHDLERERHRLDHNREREGRDHHRLDHDRERPCREGRDQLYHGRERACDELLVLLAQLPCPTRHRSSRLGAMASQRPPAPSRRHTAGSQRPSAEAGSSARAAGRAVQLPCTTTSSDAAQRTDAHDPQSEVASNPCNQCLR